MPRECPIAYGSKISIHEPHANTAIVAVPDALIGQPSNHSILWRAKSPGIQDRNGPRKRGTIDVQMYNVHLWTAKVLDLCWFIWNLYIYTHICSCIWGFRNAAARSLFLYGPAALRSDPAHRSATPVGLLSRPPFGGTSPSQWRVRPACVKLGGGGRETISRARGDLDPKTYMQKLWHDKVMSKFMHLGF